MRFSSMLVVSILAVSATLFAQHAPTPVVTHTPAPTPTVTAVHTPAVSTVHTPATTAAIHSTSATRGIVPSSTHATPSTHVVPTTNRDPSRSATTSSPPHRGFFSFLRKHEPIPSKSRSACTNGRCSTNSVATIARNTQTPTQSRLGCFVAPVPDAAAPCNPLSPCCP